VNWTASAKYDRPTDQLLWNDYTYVHYLTVAWLSTIGLEQGSQLFDFSYHLLNRHSFFTICLATAQDIRLKLTAVKAKDVWHMEPHGVMGGASPIASNLRTSAV
jgi:hypothetical protein